MPDFKMGNPAKTVISQSRTANPTWGTGAPTDAIVQVKNSYVNAASNAFAVSSEPSRTAGGQNFVAPATQLSVDIIPKDSGNK